MKEEQSLELPPKDGREDTAHLETLSLQRGDDFLSLCFLWICLQAIREETHCSKSLFKELH